MLTYNSQNATVETLIFNCLLNCNLSCEHLNIIYISYEKAKAQVLLHTRPHSHLPLPPAPVTFWALTDLECFHRPHISTNLYAFRKYKVKNIQISCCYKVFVNEITQDHGLGRREKN
ncbi:WD repeat-containing protein 66 [Platysternon megacephalum]|uniref:WD repeat-containing protein 66 n=1 Tax=Platysternon megacephalum TaxID=55544 RepID=A0A4D9EUR3_9SAUR|nr:WD repeat-containing protein 66 [Platysternon megacephalum]